MRKRPGTADSAGLSRSGVPCKAGLLILLTTMAFITSAVMSGCDKQRQPGLGREEESAPMKASEHKHTNRLTGSTSPYLLQHARNPVDWYPWGNDAFEKARKEDKPIFLSVGYSSCHWCHVMERESFENEEIARIMNEHFVSIKVDREERPDVDQIYMNAVQMMTGSGGWPMSVFLTPKLKPYFGGTYFPPEGRFGLPGFRRVLLHAAALYKDHREDVDNLGEQVVAGLQDLAANASSAPPVTGQHLIDDAVGRYRKTFDPAWGGFGQAPKFPPTAAATLLLRQYRRTGDAETLKMATVTLDHMATGGMYDQLGGGFHRYSTDREWLVPHFEKMLYDNALLAVACLDAFQVTGSPLYERTARGILDHVIRDMTDPAGGFHSALDADSEGAEGKYYVWTVGEIEEVLGSEDAAAFGRYYGLTELGNFENRNILHVPKFDERTEAELEKSRHALLAVRAKRVPPGKDDKILADWNGLMISAMSRGHQVLGDDRYSRTAERATGFVLAKMRPDGHLLHSYRAGRAHVDAFLDDYAFMLQAMIDLYEATFDPRWIEHADAIAREMTGELWDDENGGFYSTRENAPDLLVRAKTAYDGAMPAGNAVAALALMRLARLTDNKEYFAQAEKTLTFFNTTAAAAPTALARLLCAADFHDGPPQEIVISGDPDSADTKRLIAVVRQSYLPNTVVALVDPASAGAAAAAGLLPLLEGRSLVEGGPAAYVCENYTCDAPITSVDKLGERVMMKPKEE